MKMLGRLRNSNLSLREKKMIGTRQTKQANNATCIIPPRLICSFLSKLIPMLRMHVQWILHIEARLSLKCSTFSIFTDQGLILTSWAIDTMQDHAQGSNKEKCDDSIFYSDQTYSKKYRLVAFYIRTFSEKRI
jgi:hypothetical protein